MLVPPASIISLVTPPAMAEPSLSLSVNSTMACWEAKLALATVVIVASDVLYTVTSAVE